MNDNLTKPNSFEQPFGYCLYRSDQAITQAMNKRLHNYGIDRIDWQVLNAFAQQGPVSIKDVVDHLQANADHATLITSIDKYCQQGHFHCPDEESDQLLLTKQGQEFHQELSGQVDAFLEESFKGINEEEY